MTCLNDMPNFLPTRSGPGTVVFLYDRPASCTTTVVWGRHGDGWQGWIPDQPPARDEQRADLRWQTPIELGKHAQDVALRFRAHLVPPPPPITSTATLTPPPATPARAALRGTFGAAGRGSVARAAPLSATPAPADLVTHPGGKPRSCVALAGGWARCSRSFADIPTERARFATASAPWLIAAQRWADSQPSAGRQLDVEVDSTIMSISSPASQATPLATFAPRVEPATRTLQSGSGSAARSVRAHAMLLRTDDAQDEPADTHQPALPAIPRLLNEQADETPDCARQPLMRLPNVTAPNPRLIGPAAASFAEVRSEILERTGMDALAVLADVLRAPSYTTSKAGVLATSWHKAGRAIDLNQGGPFVRIAEGARFRLYVHNVDITAIFEAHGWQRIPVQGDTLEWWHYEWHPDGIAWTSAMLQVWDLPTLQAAFPAIAWATIGCAGGSNSGDDPIVDPTGRGQLCVPGAPRYHSPVETFAGCGPPIRAGDQVYQLDTILGFVGLTGQTTGPHLHLGLRVRSYDGSYPFVDICTPEWLQGRVLPDDANCYTDMVDPLAFLPRAPGNAALGRSGVQAAPPMQVPDPGATMGYAPTPIIPEGAPYQLPPPNYPGALVFTPLPNATPIGQYWSPYAEGGRYGGGSVGQWFCTHVWSGFPWCG